MNRLKGAMTALITPFRNGKIDEAKYAQLIQRQIDQGIDVVVPVGTTGESATLSHDEHKRCIEIAIEVCKGSETKVMAGAGSNSTAEAIELATFAQRAGAHAILSVAPYYNKPTQEGLYQHYKAIAQAVEIPILLYNVPSRTGVDITPQTVFRLFREFPHIYGIKEATGSIERTVELLAKEPELYVISGDDAINYPIIANGGMGAISVSANLLPDRISMLIHAGLAGQFDTAKAINDQLFDLNKVLFIESNPIPIKAAMYIAGLLETLEYRLPLTPPSRDHMAKIEEVVQKYEVRL
ncbi:MAG: 4-hydroxy-tetrahydrodipicolinate synthase [Nitratiruptor sp.]|nr:4-hydroxy-tetrahydrodipicolinate synthase [Nitratiruptor sp.]NPA83208.1 4-hydroxy-tetrahydrodipicolinate synthase [Campylobacterota bacterium]